MGARPQLILSQAASHLEVSLQRTHTRTPPNGPNRTVCSLLLIATGEHSASMLDQGKEVEGGTKRRAGGCLCWRGRVAAVINCDLLRILQHV